jgi:predicted DNA-binding transcriptional regulator YafY
MEMSGKRLEERFRLDLLLAMIPTRGGTATPSGLRVAQFQERLRAQSIEVDDRTIQRNLKALLEDKRYGVKRKKEGREYVYWADKELSRFVLKPTDAMNLIMVIDHARPYTSRTLGGNLQELYEHAQSILNKHSHRLYDWTKKVVSNTRFLNLQPGLVEPQVFQTIQDALLEGSMLDVLYQPRGAPYPKPYRLTPLGLSFQDANIYLSLVVDGRDPDTPYAWPIHRFKSAKAAGFEPAQVPAEYDIRNTSSLKSLIGLENEHPIQLELLIDEKMFQRLSENWLSPQQVLQPYDTERWHLSCELHLSQGLRLWILSQGASVEVLKPSVLRGEILAEIEQMSALYRVKSADT